MQARSTGALCFWVVVQLHEVKVKCAHWLCKPMETLVAERGWAPCESWTCKHGQRPGICSWATASTPRLLQCAAKGESDPSTSLQLAALLEPLSE